MFSKPNLFYLGCTDGVLLDTTCKIRNSSFTGSGRPTDFFFFTNIYQQKGVKK